MDQASDGTQSLELSSLPERHPAVGEALLHQCGPSTIVRLSIDPTQQPPGTIYRSIEVDWIAQPANNPAVWADRVIGWNGLDEWEVLCEQLPMVYNDHLLTELSAIAVFSLLINDLEGGVLQTVLPIGSGGDYLVRLAGADGEVQVEVSGIKDDPGGDRSRPRLQQKRTQVLQHVRVGHVSVTTFSYRAVAIVHSFLHYAKLDE